MKSAFQRAPQWAVVVALFIFGLAPQPGFAVESPSVAETRITLGEYSDRKLSDALAEAQRVQPDADYVVVTAESVMGQVTQFHKCILDRRASQIVVLRRAVFPTGPTPQTYYSWLLWKNLRPEDLTRGIPWTNEQVIPEMSKVTDDGRKTLPARLPEIPSLKDWP
jgi:hypothetical protein